jgi:hypothetical protein
MFRLNFSYLEKHPDLFPSVFGISQSQFLMLLVGFSRALRKAEIKKASFRGRVRAIGGGRRPHLSSDFEKLGFILLYYKVYPTFRLAQFIFGFDKRNVQLWVRFLEPVLFNVVKHKLELPSRKVNTVHGLYEQFPALKEILIDATERPIQRPKNKKQNKKYYSGKKKMHTVKNQIIVNPNNKKILAISETHEGKRHDKRIFDEDKNFMKIPEKALALADTAYQGIIHPFLTVVVPKKKPPNGELTKEEKQNNQQISKIRVRVEHPLSYLKHFNILSHKFRSRLDRIQQPFETIAAIYNFSRDNSLTIQ